MIKRSDLINTFIFVWMLIVAVLNREFTNTFVMVCDIISAIMFFIVCVNAVIVDRNEPKKRARLMSVIAFVFPLGYVMSAYWQFMNI